jgi:O-antigen biosynthesis protein
MFRLRRLALFLLTLAATPFLAALALTLLFFNLVHRLTRFTRSKPVPDPSVISGLASIIILNWNGRDLLAEGVPSILEAVLVDGRPHEVIVVDNGSEDDSVAFLREKYPQVRVVELPENVGFAAGNNLGVEAAQHDVVVLLNNDMVVDAGFLRPLLDGFGPGTFAVSSQIFHQDPAARREETGLTSAGFRRGMVDFEHRQPPGREPARRWYPAFWAGGGSSAFHRRRFVELGGFSEVYSPAYVEDSDLSYRAWKSGWEVLFAPESIVYHKHRASSSKRFSPAQLQALIHRNQFFFVWKNLRGFRYLFLHCLLLPWNCYRLARDHGVAVWKSVWDAAVRLPALEIEKLCTTCRGARSDREIFSMFEKPGLFFAQRRRATHPGGTGPPRLLWMTAYLPHVGRHAGAGRMFHLLSRMARNYRITLLTFLEYDEEREFLPEVEALCERVVAMRRTPPPRWQLFAYEPFDEFRTPEMTAALALAREEADFDLVQLEYTQMGCYADRAFGIPTLVTKHEVDFAACGRRASREKSLFAKARWFYNYLQVLDRETRLLKDIDTVVCMTDSDAAELRKFHTGTPVEVINTGVDLDYFSPPTEPATEPRLVFVGAYQHSPNVEAMVYFCSEILPRIRLQIPGTTMTIAGSGPPPAILSLTEIPGVEVTGFVPDIRPHMARAAVYIVPLRLGVGIRGKILEAWGMAMPVVATSVACAGLRYEHGKNLLVADSPQLFASSVVTLLKDAQLRGRLGSAGRKAAEAYYGWEAAAGRLDALYRSLIEGSRTRAAGRVS